MTSDAGWRGVGTIVLLIASNGFMTTAWYFHLKKANWSMFKAIMISWSIAFFEYCLQVPANRIGHKENGGPFGAPQLKIIQEAISLSVFAIFSTYVLHEHLRITDYLGFGLVFLGVAVGLLGKIYGPADPSDAVLPVGWGPPPPAINPQDVARMAEGWSVVSIARRLGQGSFASKPFALPHYLDTGGVPVSPVVIPDQSFVHFADDTPSRSRKEIEMVPLLGGASKAEGSNDPALNNRDRTGPDLASSSRMKIASILRSVVGQGGAASDNARGPSGALPTVVETSERGVSSGAPRVSGAEAEPGAGTSTSTAFEGLSPRASRGANPASAIAGSLASAARKLNLWSTPGGGSGLGEDDPGGSAGSGPGQTGQGSGGGAGGGES